MDEGCFEVGASNTPDSNVDVANMGPTWVLSAPGRPHVSLMNLAIRDNFVAVTLESWFFLLAPLSWLGCHKCPYFSCPLPCSIPSPFPQLFFVSCSVRSVSVQLVLLRDPVVIHLWHGLQMETISKYNDNSLYKIMQSTSDHIAGSVVNHGISNTTVLEIPYSLPLSHQYDDLKSSIWHQ